jgi:hypothetical protein
MSSPSVVRTRLSLVRDFGCCFRLLPLRVVLVMDAGQSNSCALFRFSGVADAGLEQTVSMADEGVAVCLTERSRASP